MFPSSSATAKCSINGALIESIRLILMLCWSLAVLTVCPGAVQGAPSSSAASAIGFTFKLDKRYITSAGAYDSSGRLIKTLWRRVPFEAGPHSQQWDGTNDDGEKVPTASYTIKILCHNVNYVWEGVIGNTSDSFTGPTVHRSFFPISTLAISGDTAFYAVGYNEMQPGGHRFNVANPQSQTDVIHKDPFTAFSYVATDGKRAYWANLGGLSDITFVMATRFEDGAPISFPNGQHLCLNKFPIGDHHCYPEQDWPSCLDVSRDKGHGATGLAVQVNGNVLAVAHGLDNKINLLDKNTGAFLGAISVPLTKYGSQLAIAPDGDLWVISLKSLKRYTDLSSSPKLVTTIDGGFSNPLALAVHPSNNDLILLADGGMSQQIKAFDATGRKLWTYGEAGGYQTDPTVSPNRLGLHTLEGNDSTCVAIQSDGSFWVGEPFNNRLLHISASRRYLGEIGYQPHMYVATVDQNDPRRVFAGFLEFRNDLSKPLRPGDMQSATPVKNWAVGLPKEYLGGMLAGLNTVLTFPNKRTYGLISGKPDAIVELPSSGPLRFTGIRHSNDEVWYANGDLGTLHQGAKMQAILRYPLIGFDTDGNLRWGKPAGMTNIPLEAGAPYYRGAFSGATAARFPITSSEIVVSFDQSVQGNTGFHLGGVKLGGTEWIWKTSPTGWMDGLGSFQTKEIDGSVNYGGNQVWAVGRNIVYGYHGEFFKDRSNGGVGQANQFMHYYDDGLFVGEFGLPSTRATMPAQTGLAGNSFSLALVQAGKFLYLYHNDESSHAGVHRWRIDDWDGIFELSGSGRSGEKILLH